MIPNATTAKHLCPRPTQTINLTTNNTNEDFNQDTKFQSTPIERKKKQNKKMSPVRIQKKT